MEAKRSQRSCFTQTSCLGEDLGEDSELEYLSAHEEFEAAENISREFSGQGEVAEMQDVALMGDKVSPQLAAGEEEPGESESPTQSVAVEPDIAADRASGGSPGAGNGKRGEALRSIPSVSAAVQAGDDCRAGFPASRSSSAQVCLCSRAVNTEVSMMSKTRPVGWVAQTSVDAACNTEWSFRAQSSHVQLESNDHLRICDWKAGTSRPDQPKKPTGKNSASGCCQKVLQRAVEAELQLLAIHYEMCYRHCLKVYELAVEENTYFGSRCEKKTELHSSLLLVLGELDRNYNNMRMKVSTGTPLKELPPLSVELKFSPISSFYIPSKFFMKSLYSDDLSGAGKADLEELKRQAKGISGQRGKSQAGGGHPGDSASPEAWEEQPKDPALEREVKTVRSGNQHSSVHGDSPKPAVPEEPGENSLPKTSTCSSVKASGIFVSPYALNLNSFTKLIKRLQERHPEFSRDEVVEAVKEVRRMNKGVLSGMAISSIEEQASALLRR